MEGEEVEDIGIFKVGSPGKQKNGNSMGLSPPYEAGTCDPPERTGFFEFFAGFIRYPAKREFFYPTGDINEYRRKGQILSFGGKVKFKPHQGSPDNPCCLRDKFPVRPDGFEADRRTGLHGTHEDCRSFRRKACQRVGNERIDVSIEWEFSQFTCLFPRQNAWP